LGALRSALGGAAIRGQQFSMPYFDQEPFAVRCEWGAAGLEHAAASEVVVVVDVLSFTTTVSAAVDRGVTVLPWRSGHDDAGAFAAAHGAELAAPRDARPDFG
jgi:2-phosphosulfolactate phosphatase